MFELGLSTSRAVCDVLCVKYLVSVLLTLSCGTASAALVEDLSAEFRGEFREHLSCQVRTRTFWLVVK